VGDTVLLRFLAVGMNHTFAMHPHGFHFEVIGTDGRRLPYMYEKDTLPIVSGERYDVLIKVGAKHKGLCTSCNIGKGISIMHDHNLIGEASDGTYPKGPLTISKCNNAPENSSRVCPGIAKAAPGRSFCGGCIREVHVIAFCLKHVCHIFPQNKAARRMSRFWPGASQSKPHEIVENHFFGPCCG